MITINSMYKAIEIAQAASATVWRVKRGYLITTSKEQLHFPFVCTFTEEEA